MPRSGCLSMESTKRYRLSLCPLRLYFTVLPLSQEFADE